jgi:hypothetical protein
LYKINVLARPVALIFLIIKKRINVLLLSYC